MSEHWTAADVPDQTGRTILITGANSGIGFEAAKVVAAKGATTVLGCRNRTKAEEAAGLIRADTPDAVVEILELDLGDLDSVDRAAGEFLTAHDRLDVLVNNAGLMATPHQHTAQGFEMQFGVNHLGHFALTGRLLPRMVETGDARVVSISSQGHRAGRIDFDDLQGERKYSPWKAYSQSKLANLLFTRELGRLLDMANADVIAVAAHPGASSTNLGHESAGGILATVMEKGRPLFDRFFAQDAAMGSLPTLRAATDPAVVNDDYFGPDGMGEQRGHPVTVGRTKRARDDDTARRLWRVSESLTGVTYAL